MFYIIYYTVLVTHKYVSPLNIQCIENCQCHRLIAVHSQFDHKNRFTGRVFALLSKKYCQYQIANSKRLKNH